MKKVILTGATGFIGKQAIAPLIDADFEVHAVTSRNPPQSTYPEVKWHEIDLFQNAAVEALLREVQPSHLMHFAWDTTPGKYWTSAANLSWVNASLNLLKSFTENGGERAVFAGTCAEYDWDSGTLSEICSPFRPKTLYGTCKRSLYEICESWSKLKGTSFAWGYIFFLYGPYEHPSRFVPTVIQGLLDQREVPCSHGEQIRDFSDVRDVAKGFVQLLNSEYKGGINIASGTRRTLKSIAEMIAHKIGRPELLRFGAIKAPPDDPKELVADIALLHKHLGWEPEYPLEKSLQDTIEWWKKTRSSQL
jgi:nucleoside-diphosphate-sugar epimerase